MDNKTVYCLGIKLPITANKHSAHIPEQGVTLGSGDSRGLLKY